MRQFVLVIAWLIFLTGSFSLLLPEHAQRWGGSVLAILGAGPEPVTIAVGESYGHTRDITASLADHLSERGHTVHILETERPEDAGELLSNREAHLALLPAGDVSRYDQIQLAQFETAYIHVVAPQDLEVASFADIIDLNVGVSGIFANTESLLARMYQELNFGNRTFTTPPRLLLPGEMHAALRQGKVDVLVGFFPLMAPEMNALLQSGYYRLLPFPEASAFSRLIPGLERTTMPENLYGPGRNIPPEPLPAAVVPLFLMTQPAADYAMLAAVLQLLDGADWTLAFPATQLATEAGNSLLPRHPLVQDGAFRELQDSGYPSIFWIILTGLALAVLVWQYYSEYQMKQRRALASQVRGIIESGSTNLGEEGPGILVEMARQMMDGQNRAMQHWLNGRYNTLQMQLLMALYLGRSQQLLARYSMMPRGLEGEVHPQRRPWQPPEKTGIEGPHPGDRETHPDHAATPFNSPGQNAFPPPHQRRTETVANEWRDPARQENPPQHRDGRRQAASASFAMQDTPHPSEPAGEDITHEVLPADYDGDIIAVRKRPRRQSNDDAVASTPEASAQPKSATSPRPQQPRRRPAGAPSATQPPLQATPDKAASASPAPSRDRHSATRAQNPPENKPRNKPNGKAVDNPKTPSPEHKPQDKPQDKPKDKPKASSENKSETEPEKPHAQQEQQPTRKQPADPVAQVNEDAGKETYASQVNERATPPPDDANAPNKTVRKKRKKRRLSKKAQSAKEQGNQAQDNKDSANNKEEPTDQKQPNSSKTKAKKTSPKPASKKPKDGSQDDQMRLF